MFHFHMLLGLFALLTAVLAGAAIGRLCGLTASEGAYLVLFLLAIIGWHSGRRTHEKE